MYDTHSLVSCLYGILDVHYLEYGRIHLQILAYALYLVLVTYQDGVCDLSLVRDGCSLYDLVVICRCH